MKRWMIFLVLFLTPLFAACGGKAEDITRDLDKFFDSLPIRTEPHVITAKMQEIQTTMAFQRVMQRAALHLHLPHRLQRRLERVLRRRAGHPEARGEPRRYGAR